jgi:hypothetical protein
MKIRLTRSMVFLLWMASFPVAMVLWYFPYVDFPIRVATWTAAFVAVAGAVFFAWRRPLVRWALLAVYLLMVLFLAWPSARAVDRTSLRSEYCSALKAYVGTHYVWGGQGRLGIDCSGLVQKGMMDALATQGLEHADPAFVRQSLSLYWHRTTAKVLGQGFAGRTVPVTTCLMLNTLDYSLVEPGDLAVTDGGDHVMAYLGDRTWIAADPGAGSVRTFTIPEKTNVYFSSPMRIMRWKVLAADP